MPTQPNLIIFNPDQWRADVMGHFGNPAAVTPNLDQLVQEDAVSFRRAFCQNTVCTPSRCSFMTGLYPHVHGHRTMHHMVHEEANQRHLFKVLKEQGYYIWWGGKNDLYPGQEGWGGYVDEKFTPTKKDFERWGMRQQEGNHDNIEDWRGTSDEDTYYSFFKGLLDKGDDEFYLDGDWVNVFGALDFIRNYHKEQPFCVFLPLSYPHPPYCVEEPYFSAIDRDAIPAQIPAPENWEGKPSLLKGINQRQNLQSWSEERWRELRAVYYGMCTRIDHQAGMVLETLKEANLYDNSAFFLFSDHGDFTGDYGLVEKTQNTFEDCLSNVPFIIKPPKGTALKPGVRQETLVELVDFTATVYDLLDIDPGYDSFGKSLLPVLAGETEEHRDAVFCEGGRRYGEEQAMEKDSTSNQNPTGLYWPRVGLQSNDDEPYHTKAAMCRTNQYKYTMRLYEQDELYDLINDPVETTNRIDDPTLQEVARQLKDRLLYWYMETCDVVPRKTDKRDFVGQ